MRQYLYSGILQDLTHRVFRAILVGILAIVMNSMRVRKGMSIIREGFICLLRTENLSALQ
jgi:hypothetical protein